MFSAFNAVLYMAITGACMGFFHLDAFDSLMVLAAVACGQTSLALWEE